MRVAAGFVDSANTIAQRGPIGNTPQLLVVLLSAVDLTGSAGTRLRRGVRINAGSVSDGTSGGLLGGVRRTHLHLSLRAPFDKLRTSGNLDEVEHTSANRRCYDDEIATLRSQ